MTAKSRTGYVITYTNCLIIWASKMQTIVSLSSTESEYVALSTALRNAIVVINFLKEIRNRDIADVNCEPDVMCKMFQDNSRALELARVPKM
eukprot:10958083-Ditylum_brightwellii.AAC.1